MRFVRIVGGIIAGYIVFALGSMFLVGIAMSREGALIVALCLVALALIGGAAGSVAAAVGGPERLWAGYFLTGLVAIATLANLLMRLGAEPVWYKAGTLVLTVPAILLVSRRVRS